MPSGTLPVRATAYTADGLTGLVELYARSPEQLQPLRAVASLRADGLDQPAVNVAVDADAAASAGSGVLRRAHFSMPLAAVPAGAYVAQVTIKSGSDTVAELRREVEVVGGSAPPAAIEPAPLFRPRDILDGDFVRPGRAALSRSPAAVEAARGMEAFAASRYADAAVALTAAMHQDPANAVIAFVLGWAEEARGDERAAISAWRAAAADDPRMLPAHLALADSYLRIAQPALAAQALRAGLIALPDSAELHARLARIEGKN